MENFRANQSKLQDSFKTSLGPDAFAKIAETNMAMFKAAATAFMPKNPGANGAAPSAGGAAGEAKDDELSALKQQMAAMQDKLDRLGK